MAQGLAGFEVGRAPEKALASLEHLRREAVKLSVREGWTACHAAAAKVGGRLVIFPGAAGSGKSTLSVVLARRGHAVADELVLLRGVEALVPPMPLSVPEGILRHLPPAALWRVGPDELPNGKALLRPPVPLAGMGRVAAIILLRRDGSRGEVSLRAASRYEVARGLLENIVRHSNGGPGYAAQRRRVWKTFCALLDKSPSYVLCGDLLSDGDAAAGRVERILEGGRNVQR